MIIETQYYPELGCSGNSCKPQITNPWLDVEKRRLYTTEGHLIVKIPIELSEGDTSGYIPKEVFCLAREKSGYDHDMEIKATGDKVYLSGAVFDRPTGKPLDYESVIPCDKDGLLTIGVDVRLLMKIAKIIGETPYEKQDPEHPVLMYMSVCPNGTNGKNGESVEPIKIQTARSARTGLVAVLMPARKDFKV